MKTRKPTHINIGAEPEDNGKFTSIIKIVADDGTTSFYEQRGFKTEQDAVVAGTARVKELLAETGIEGTFKSLN